MEYFLVCFEHVAEADASGEGRARAIIKYLRGWDFEFYCQKVTVHGELTENAKSYKVVKTALKEEIGSKRAMQESIEAAISVRLTTLDDFLESLMKADVAYREVNFID